MQFSQIRLQKCLRSFQYLFSSLISPFSAAVTQTLWGCDGKAMHSGLVPQTHTELYGPRQPSLASLLRDSRF